MKAVVTAICTATFCALSTLLGAAPDLGAKASGTPYDPYMGPVRKVVRQLDANYEAELNQVHRLMRTARRFRYRHAEAYVANDPATTARRRSGDCKDKSLWLLAKIDEADARFVIGRMAPHSRVKHAWVYWEHEGRWYVLDPTHHSAPIPVDKVRRNHYVPFYSYAKTGPYLHAAAGARYARSAKEQEEPVASQFDQSDAETAAGAEVRRAKAVPATASDIASARKSSLFSWLSGS